MKKRGKKRGEGKEGRVVSMKRTLGSGSSERRREKNELLLLVSTDWADAETRRLRPGPQIEMQLSRVTSLSAVRQEKSK